MLCQEWIEYWFLKRYVYLESDEYGLTWKKISADAIKFQIVLHSLCILTSDGRKTGDLGRGESCEGREAEATVTRPGVLGGKQQNRGVDGVSAIFGGLMALVTVRIQSKGANEIFLKRKELKPQTTAAERCNDYLNYSIVNKSLGVVSEVKT